MGRTSKPKPGQMRKEMEVAEYHPLDPGPSWYPCEPGGFDAIYQHRLSPLKVIISWAPHPDGKRWLHVSVSHPLRLPTYDELCEVKRRFVGADKKAVMVFPAEGKHVNLHRFCLHLWHCLDKDPLPEFSGVIGGIRTI